MKKNHTNIFHLVLPIAVLSLFGCDNSSNPDFYSIGEFPESSSAKEAVSSDASINSCSSAASDTVTFSAAVESSSSVFTAPETFTDSRDGKVYKLAKIGTQIWMAENLNFGDSAVYDFNDAQKVCPESFHLPTFKEFQTLVQFVGGAEVAAQKLKSTTGWPIDEQYGNWNGTDDFGFNAKPIASGIGAGTDENFWSSTRNSRNYITGDFLKINPIPIEKKDSLGRNYNYQCYNPSTNTVLNDPNLACFINGDPETKLSVRCLSNTGECGGKTYDNTKQFCQEGNLYDICRQRTYDATKYECKNDTLYERSSGSVFKYSWFLLNPEKTYGNFKDERDGQIYKTIDIDGVVWFAENLNYASEGSICPVDDEKYCDAYGRLYATKQVVEELCPKGTHLATSSELTPLKKKYGIEGLFTAYTAYFEDDDFENAFSELTNESGLGFLENGGTKESWDDINRMSCYIGSDFFYYLYYRWEGQFWGGDAGSVRCIVD